MRTTPILLVFALWFAGCGSAPPPLRLTSPAPTRDVAALAVAGEAFYTASTPAAMRAAVEAARVAGPETALYHELAAELAGFENRDREQLDHLLMGLLDPEGDAPLYLLNEVVELPWTFAERDRVEAVLDALRRDHPRADVRVMAAWVTSHAAHLEGRAGDQIKALAEVHGRLPLALIGTWDNDQGKGFDAEYPPERELDLKRRYPGARMEVGWRTAYPLDPRGKVHLESVMEPVAWQVAYAASAVEVKTAGDYELRVSTSDPIKVWVNDALTFSGARLSNWTFDGVILPIKLAAGPNRVLIKTAHGATGAWMLTVRLTGPGGAEVAEGALRPLPADTHVVAGTPNPEPMTEESLIPTAVTGVADGVRKGVLASAFAAELGLNVARVKLAEAMLTASPDALYVQYLKAVALWDNQERSGTSDLLNQLAERFGEDFLLIRLKQARFWEQQGLGEKARAQLTQLWQAHPDRDGAAFALADMLAEEKWQEERCRILETLNRDQPAYERVQDALADCYEKLRFFPQAEAMQRALLERLPNSLEALSRLHWLSQGRDDHAAARRYAERWVKAWPHDRGAYQALAETLRRDKQPEAARKYLEELVEMAPTAPEAYDRLAQIAMQGGNQTEAVRLWKASLAREPENESLANRLQYLAPEKAGPWMADVPDEAALEAAVQRREEVKPLPGSNIIYLMDDEVTSLGPDGSTINIVSLVAHATNQEGTDSLAQMQLRSASARVLHAFAVDPTGRRLEVSSIRDATVRFRQLTEGSTIVLQYRVDSRPDGYLAQYMARQWWFQAPGVQTLRSRWVVWAPKGTTFLEEGLGGYTRELEDKTDQVRALWQAENTPPVVGEPAMPTLGEVAWHVTVTTVPDWDTFWKWEKALLQDAFRSSPELEAIAQALAQGATSPREKVERIHAYLMTNIRYQQDYEGLIAGVKPHAAPVVLARQYGDCKDKAVLFIAIARLMGIEVHFALVRTRDVGPVRREVPMQQFNHAIVYVPEQPGIPEGRFYDPTVDALDVDVLRHDDQGTLSLVFNPATDQHGWREIPYQDAGVDTTLADTVLNIAADGSATGEMVLTSHGRLGSLFRRAARNATQFAQLMQQQVARTFSGARLTGQQIMQLDSVFEPAKVQLNMEVPGLARREGKELRLKAPIEWSPQDWFGLADRQWPVLLGAPRTLHWRVTMNFPEGTRTRRLPEDLDMGTPCLHVTRTVRGKGLSVVVDQQVQMLCERVAVADYPAHRTFVEDLMRHLDEALVFDVSRSRTDKAGAPTVPAAPLR